jgi:DNA-binding NarL/FixJ family response regulator
MTGTLHIAIAQPSEIARRGIRTILEEFAENFAVTLTDVTTLDQLRDLVATDLPDILLADNSFVPFLPALLPSRVRVVLMQCSWSGVHYADLAAARAAEPSGHYWAEMITMEDSALRIHEKMLNLVGGGRLVRRHEPLTQREKDVVVGVVKGLTNRMIAEELHLSHHTVGTHRRNISAKLDIHSTSGLIVYAISNKLVNLDDLPGFS